ncbi:MAG: hypothetical protein K9N55_19685 [Phycisphaerae bacterium]|nr:hypothetical protein [Phycisphaerae bacterium]
MANTRNGLQKSVCGVFDAYHGWNGVDLDQRTGSTSVALLEQAIDQLIETRPTKKANHKASPGSVSLIG